MANPGATPTWLKSGAWQVMRATSPLRVLPDFLIIGAQKCGTTSLFNYLGFHPQVMPSLKKETSYFGSNPDRSLQWYRAHFPTQLTKSIRQRQVNQKVMVGEASTAYLFHPQAARLAYEAVPSVRLIASLRNPVERALSQYFFYCKKKLEFDDIATAFESAFNTFERDYERWKNWKGSLAGLEADTRTYLLRGLYGEQLQPWRKMFGESSLLVINCDQFWESPSTVWGQIVDFLDLEFWKPESFRKHNKGTYDAVPTEIVDRLREFYQTHEPEWDALNGPTRAIAANSQAGSK